MMDEKLRQTAAGNEILELHATINGLQEAQKAFLSDRESFMNVTGQKIKSYRQKINQLYLSLEEQMPAYKSALEEARKALEEIDKDL